MIDVWVILEQVPFVKLYVTVYVPGILAARLTSPEMALRDSPAAELNEPPVCPLRVTCAEPVLQ